MLCALAIVGAPLPNPASKKGRGSVTDPCCDVGETAAPRRFNRWAEIPDLPEGASLEP